jgi:hypothetical protein
MQTRTSMPHNWVGRGSSRPGAWVVTGHMPTCGDSVGLAVGAGIASDGATATTTAGDTGAAAPYVGARIGGPDTTEDSAIGAGTQSTPPSLSEPGVGHELDPCSVEPQEPSAEAIFPQADTSVVDTVSAVDMAVGIRADMEAVTAATAKNLASVSCFALQMSAFRFESDQWALQGSNL